MCSLCHRSEVCDFKEFYILCDWMLTLHFMKAECKYVEVMFAFAGYQQHSPGGLTVVSHRQECIHTDANN